MNNRIIGQVGILAAVGSLLAAMSMMLGRIYFLQYYKILEIPTSDFQPHVTDYAVMSPDVTIWGVGIFIVTVILVWWRGPVESTTKWKQFAFISVASIFAMCIGVWSLFRSESGLGEHGIWWTVIAAAAMFFGAASFPRVRMMSANVADAETITFFRLAAAITFLVVVITLILLVTGQTLEIAKLDAGRVLREAPRATIALNSSAGHELLRNGTEGYDGDSDWRKIRLSSPRRL